MKMIARLLAACLGMSVLAAETPTERIDLFNGKDLTNWYEWMTVISS